MQAGSVNSLKHQSVEARDRRIVLALCGHVYLAGRHRAVAGRGCLGSGTDPLSGVVRLVQRFPQTAPKLLQVRREVVGHPTRLIF